MFALRHGSPVPITSVRGFLLKTLSFNILRVKTHFYSIFILQVDGRLSTAAMS